MLIETPNVFERHTATICYEMPELVEIAERKFMVTKTTTIAKVMTRADPYKTEYVSQVWRAEPGQLVQLKCGEQLAVIEYSMEAKPYGKRNVEKVAKIFGGRTTRRCIGRLIGSDGVLRITENETITVATRKIEAEEDGNETSHIQTAMAALQIWRDRTLEQKLNHSDTIIRKLGIQAIQEGVASQQHYNEMAKHLAKAITEEPMDYWQKWYWNIGSAVAILLGLTSLITSTTMGGMMSRINIRQIGVRETPNGNNRRPDIGPTPSAPPLLNEPPQYVTNDTKRDYRAIAKNPHAEMNAYELDIYRKWLDKMPDADPLWLAGFIMNVTKQDGLWKGDKIMVNMVVTVNEGY
jgi:hypothetical protein